MSSVSTTIKYTNPLIEESMEEEARAEVVKRISQLVLGTSFAPCTVKWRGNWAIQAGDVVRVTDRSGNLHTVLVQSQTITISGGMSASIFCPGVPAEDADFYASTSSDRRASSAEDNANTYTDAQLAEILKSANAYTDEVFGRITDGNEVAY